jgi:iron complex outermembrane recepter protein
MCTQTPPSSFCKGARALAILMTPALAIAPVLLAPQVQAQAASHDKHKMDEVVVTAEHQRARSELPHASAVLEQEALRQAQATTLGETLQFEPGLRSGTFGVGVGLPVIRGQSGNRVRVLSNGLGSQDAAAVSADHNNSLEPFLAERIEILRGPQTLWYGSGATGGVVNVLDGRILPEPLPATTGSLAARWDSASQGRVAMGKVRGGNADWGWHLDGLWRESQDVKIPGFALDAEGLSRLTPDEPAPEQPAPEGVLGNSSTQADSAALGLSRFTEGGHWGLAVSHYANNYGLPPGAHHHHHEHEDHGAEADPATLLEDPDHADEHEDEAPVSVRIDMEQTRFELAGEEALEGWFDRLTVKMAHNDYRHQELEAGEVATEFANNAEELRLSLTHAGPVEHRFGLHWSQSDFSLVGEEAFMPSSDTQQLGLFGISETALNAWALSLGWRWEQQDQTLAVGCSRQDDSLSFSGQALYTLSEQTNTYINLSHAERAPRVEERFSNQGLSGCKLPEDPEDWVVHAASARYEIGNPALDTETANTLELGWRRHRGDWMAEVNAFYSQYQDYIYTQDTEQFEETWVSRFTQADADFYGLEAEATLALGNTRSGHWDLTLAADWVRAALQSGEALPRQPSPRLSAQLSYNAEHWQWSGRWLRSLDHTRLAPNETSTDGYDRFDLWADYHLQAWVLHAKLKNLTNTRIRDNTSPLKLYAPEPGRSLEAGVTYSF